MHRGSEVIELTVDSCGYFTVALSMLADSTARMVIKVANRTDGK